MVGTTCLSNQTWKEVLWWETKSRIHCEVSYRREGKGFQYFEPLHIQYVPVRKEVIDIIEVQVAETTGELVKLGEGNTMVTLHLT